MSLSDKFILETWVTRIVGVALLREFSVREIFSAIFQITLERRNKHFKVHFLVRNSKCTFSKNGLVTSFLHEKKIDFPLIAESLNSSA